MITVVGSSNVDYICHNKRLPEPGETIYGDDFLVSPGGKGANQAAAAARLGVPTVFLSKVGGNDRNAQVLWDGFQWAGVDARRVEKEPDLYCGIGMIMIGEKAQNLITIIAGANARVTPEYVEKNRAQIIASKLIMTEFMIPLETAEYAVKIAKQAGIQNIVNPAPAFPISDQFYNLIDIITPNENEATVLTGIEVKDQKSARNAAQYFHRKNVPNVVITMGAQGAFISNFEHDEFIPGIPMKAIDTSGAGDSFNGGLACALWEGKDLFTAARFATAVAALSVTKAGTFISMPTRQDVNVLLKKHSF